MIDPLDKISLSGTELRQFNFINNLAHCHFRRHFRQGLRSHIFEILNKEDVEKESHGLLMDGIKMYPRAVPQYMLRIMRTRFTDVEIALGEVKKYKVLLKYLGSELIAQSQEFIVEYKTTDLNRCIILCGLQEYIDGVILDPWSLWNTNSFKTYFESKFRQDKINKKSYTNGVHSIATFIQKIREMIFKDGYIPDLAGNGNMVITASGKLKLVDINNIIRINQNNSIILDDKLYPSCDKSVEVLAILEEKILNKTNLLNDPLYGFFLTAKRKGEVKILEKRFFQNLKSYSSQ